MLTAQELQAKREAQHLTQAQLAQAIGAEENLIARYEQGELPVSTEHEAKLQGVWQRKLTVPKASEKRAVKKTPSTKAPSMTEWLKSVAHDTPDRRPASSTTGEAEASTTQAAQAASRLTSDKQRRAALNNLLRAALGQIDKLFAEDKQLRATAEAIEQLDPVYQQVMLGLINQLERLEPTAQAKSHSAPEQMIQLLKEPSLYITVLNYLEAAMQILKQSELADSPALVARLQNLSAFDLSTLQILTKRYQTLPASGGDERTG